MKPTADGGDNCHVVRSDRTRFGDAERALVVELERLALGDLVLGAALGHLVTQERTLGGAPIAQLHAAIADASEEERAADEAALRAQLGDGGSAGGDETTAGDGTMVSSATGAASMNGGGARRRARRRERRRALH